MEENITLGIKLPKVHDIELVAIEGLNLMSKHLGITDERIGEARILVTEGIINGLEHSGDDNPYVNVTFTMTKNELIIDIEDFGVGFKPEEIKDPNIVEKLGTTNKRGWGLKLMKSLSDDFKIESSPSGTKITIRKNLK